jgi:transcriptional regulator with XRE-family HTH domain
MAKYGEIGQRLREFGESKHWSRTEFADRLGISYQALTNYITGLARPGNKLQQRLRTIDCDVEWIMTGRSATLPTETTPGYCPNMRWVFDYCPNSTCLFTKINAC